MYLYWQETNYRSVAQAQTFSELFTVALAILKAMPQPVGQVCGPISSGGVGSIEQNVIVFNQAIKTLQSEGKNIFNQMPFQLAMHRIKESLGQQSNLQLLEQFYLPLFESGLIKTLYFLPNWQSSHGASWEHAQAKRLGFEIIYL